MHLTLSTVLLLCYLGGSYCAVSFEKQNPKAEKGKCLPSWSGIGPLNYGETKSIPNDCVSVTCSENGVQYTSCGVYGNPPDGCKYEEPPKGTPHPDCCEKKIVCN